MHLKKNRLQTVHIFYFLFISFSVVNNSIWPDPTDKTPIKIVPPQIPLIKGLQFMDQCTVATFCQFSLNQIIHYHLKLQFSDMSQLKV